VQTTRLPIVSLVLLPSSGHRAGQRATRRDVIIENASQIFLVALRAL